MTPLVSVIIPTANRPHFLPRAVASAVEGMAFGEVEVIVVPNGKSDTWKEALRSYAKNGHVRCEPIATPHANAARNHGMTLARGKFIRFLDDDDYLLPGSISQLEHMLSSKAEVCSGLIKNVDYNGSGLGTLSVPKSSDFVSAVTAMTGFLLPVGNVFLRSSLNGLQWNEGINRGQDYVWMISLAAARDWQWQHLNHHVGVWFQHEGDRISSVRVDQLQPAPIISALVELHATLLGAGRLSDGRAEAIALALWDLVHRRFPLDPQFWHEVARKAAEIFPASRPRHPIFQRWPFDSVDPLIAEWGLLPARFVTTRYRYWKRNIFGWDYRRRL